ncbi:hypothetical protein [Silvimonas iriomotensis]|nr:hypothetical protein [Silvimonas iriomotensis]
MEYQSDENASPGELERLAREEKRHEELVFYKRRFYFRVINLLRMLFVAGFILALIHEGLYFFLENKKIEVNQSLAAKDQTDGRPPVVITPWAPPTGPVTSQSQGSDFSGPDPGPGPGPEPGRIDFAAFSGIVSTLLDTLKVPKEEATKTIDELRKEAISGGREITVEAAKKILDKIFDDKKETPDKPGTVPVWSAGSTSFQIIQNCSKADALPPVIYPPKTPVPHQHKRTCTCQVNSQTAPPKPVAIPASPVAQ